MSRFYLSTTWTTKNVLFRCSLLYLTTSLHHSLQHHLARREPGQLPSLLHSRRQMRYLPLSRSFCPLWRGIWGRSPRKSWGGLRGFLSSMTSSRCTSRPHSLEVSRGGRHAIPILRLGNRCSQRRALFLSRRFPTNKVSEISMKSRGICGEKSQRMKITYHADTERPDVRFRWEDAVSEDFDGAPL